jgi:uncharacterized protein YqgC (DUF456 family)
MLGAMSTGGEVVVGLVIAVGLVGVLIPVLPGLLLVWGAVAVWSFEESSATGWVVLGVVTALLAVGTVVKYVVPGRRLRQAGVPWSSTVVGGLLGLVGFFVIPVVGLLIGFVLGVYLAERARLHAHDAAWQSTKHALAAAGWSMVIELSAGIAMTLVWIAGVLV